MDTTDNLGLPYPQCNPPLTKDASDIEQFRDLAEAVDAAVQVLADEITQQLVRPDACRFNSSTQTSTVTDNVMFLTTLSFDNTAGNSMTDTVNGVIRIQRDGWYLCGFWVTSTVATDVQTRGRFLVNGEPASNFQGPGGIAQPGIQDCNGAEVLFLRAQDGLTIATRNGSPGTSVDYLARVWTVLVAPNV
jgi:hypothetical protein